MGLMRDANGREESRQGRGESRQGRVAAKLLQLPAEADRGKKKEMASKSHDWRHNGWKEWRKKSEEIMCFVLAKKGKKELLFEEEVLKFCG